MRNYKHIITNLKQDKRQPNISQTKYEKKVTSQLSYFGDWMRYRWKETKKIYPEYIVYLQSKYGQAHL